MKSRRFPWVGVFAVLALGLGASLPVAADVEVYRPRGRLASELEPIAHGMLSPAGSAVADPASGALLLRGDRNALDEVLSVLRKLDVEPARFSVEMQFASREEAELLGFDLSGVARAGTVRIGRRRPARGVAVRLEATSATTGSRTRARVSVLEGRSAEIWTGTLHPVTHTHVWRRHPAGVSRAITSTELVSVRRGFRVRARRAGNGEVDLTLHPVFESGDPERGIQTAGAETRVRLRPGELVAIAGVDESSDSADAGIATAGRAATRSERVLLVRVDEPARPQAREAGPQ